VAVMVTVAIVLVVDANFSEKPRNNVAFGHVHTIGSISNTP
jgi:hypothetical protein